MRPITFEGFSKQRVKKPKRRVFASCSGVQKLKANPSFSVKFYESIGPVYEADTGYRLIRSFVYENYWNYLPTEDDITKVEAWEAKQNCRVFLRDCLSCSIALSLNMKDVETGERTECGELEYQAKNHCQAEAISALVERMSFAINDLPCYNSTHLIAAVPARPGKTTPDLPSILVNRIAQHLGMTDVTACFSYGGPKGQLKGLPLDQKWAAWEGAKLSMTEEGAEHVAGQPVILIDDKYQSGVSANFVGMILQRHGAADVYGLYAVKTMRDTDNT